MSTSKKEVMTVFASEIKPAVDESSFPTNVSVHDIYFSLTLETLPNLLLGSSKVLKEFVVAQWSFLTIIVTGYDQ